MCPDAMARIDLSTTWDFARPEVSEQRFRALQAGASPDDRAVLQTQIARSHGLRRQFAEARAQLAPVQAQLATLGAEPRVRYHLELGRSWVSATHPPAELTPQARAAAREAYLEALSLALAVELDDLAIDAMHMLPFVETDPLLALQWNQQALALASASSQPAARRWEPSLRNNLGLDLHRLGRLDEALAMFQANLSVTERLGNPTRLRIAHWMVGWTLRGLGRHAEALAVQQRLERENDAAGTPDPHVYRELVELHTALGNQQQAAVYAAKGAALR
jgi:tetratricopeptide (TPR) repeat protein